MLRNHSPGKIMTAAWINQNSTRPGWFPALIKCLCFHWGHFGKSEHKKKSQMWWCWSWLMMFIVIYWGTYCKEKENLLNNIIRYVRRACSAPLTVTVTSQNVCWGHEALLYISEQLSSFSHFIDNQISKQHSVLYNIRVHLVIQRLL